MSPSKNLRQNPTASKKKPRKESNLSGVITQDGLDKRRLRVLFQSGNQKTDGYVVYWMNRDQRINDNWAIIYSQQRALKENKPLLVVFIIDTSSRTLPVRRLRFILEGLAQIKSELKCLNIEFKLLVGNEFSEIINDFFSKLIVSLLVCDFSPLREGRLMVDQVVSICKRDPVEFVQVDAHNIVPIWVTSDKQETAARTIRPKIHRYLTDFLIDFPQIKLHHTDSSNSVLPRFINEYDPLDPSILTYDQNILQDVSNLPEWCKPGYVAGMQELEKFCEIKLKNYASDRNDPTKEAQSFLSLWFNTGQISVQRAVLEVQKYANSHRSPSIVESRDAFIEEAVVRRELSENFCYYNEHYDSIQGASKWAQETLHLHMKDQREYVYSLNDFEKAQTHDDLWNAAQKEGVIQGKIHGFMRMYWAKKILEWTLSPEEALRIGIYLNDKYNMDGGDPNGYVGVLWSIGGIHDQGWGERSIFGKIRFMKYSGCRKKFNVAEYIHRWIKPHEAND